MDKQSRLTRLRARHQWLDHLVLAGQRYTTNHGDHYAAAITYFSVLALVPLLMIAFAVAGFVLAAQPELLQDVKEGIAKSAPGELGDTLGKVVDEAIESRTAVGILGLLLAAYSGLGWMGNLREALTAQWSQAHQKGAFLRTKGADALALLGLGLALVLSLGITAAGSGFATDLLELVDLAEHWWARVLLVVLAVLLSLLGNWLVFLWVIARLPREPVTLRSAARAAVLGALGFEVLKQVGTFYLRSLGESPAAAVFGPVLGLLVFAFLVSRFLLFVTAWAATARENEQRSSRGERALPDGRGLRPPERLTDQPRPPAVIRPNVVVRGGPDGRSAAGLLGAGAVLGLGLARLLFHRRPARGK